MKRSAITAAVFLALGLPVASFAASTTAASTTPTSAELTQEMQQLAAQNAALQKQMQQVQQQMVTMQKAQKAQAAAAPTKPAKPGQYTPPEAYTNLATQPLPPKPSQPQFGLINTPNEQETALISTSTTAFPGRGAPTGSSAQTVTAVPDLEWQNYYTQMTLKALKQSGYMGGTPVTTSPYLGVRSQYNGSDLIINMSSVNTDVALLQQEQQLENAATSLGIPLPTHPRLNLSGMVQIAANYRTPYSGSDQSNIYINDAELDMMAQVNPWILAYMNFLYPQSGPTGQAINSSMNSYVEVDRAFITVGNLNKFPVYGTVGQAYVPFGQYNTYMISDPLTKDLGRTKATTAILGYHSKSAQGLDAQVYGFNGFTTQTGTACSGASCNISEPSNINQWGANTDYSFDVDGVSSDTGVSYISNLADSIYMQNDGNPNVGGFTGFGGSNGGESLVHYVPGIDGREQLGYGPFTLIGEYVGALESFDPSNMSFNGQGARPQALDTEGVVTFNLLGKPTSFAVAYNHSWEALGLGFPENRYSATINTSVAQDMLFSVEYRYSRNYAASDTAGGNDAVPVGPAGQSENLITAELTAYF